MPHEIVYTLGSCQDVPRRGRRNFTTVATTCHTIYISRILADICCLASTPVSASQQDTVNNQRMSTRRKLVEPDVNTDEAPVSEDARRWRDTAGSGSPSPDSINRSSISFKPKEPTLSSVVVGRAIQSTTGLSRSPLGTELGRLVDDIKICRNS